MKAITIMVKIMIIVTSNTDDTMATIMVESPTPPVPPSPPIPPPSPPVVDEQLGLMVLNEGETSDVVDVAAAVVVESGANNKPVFNHSIVEI